MELWSEFDSSTEDVIKIVEEHGPTVLHAIGRSYHPCVRTEKERVLVISQRELGMTSSCSPCDVLPNFRSIMGCREMSIYRSRRVALPLDPLTKGELESRRRHDSSFKFCHLQNICAS